VELELDENNIKVDFRDTGC